MRQDDINNDIRKLLTLLKKILKNHPYGSDEMAKFLDQKSFNINLCFLTFMPMSPEDFSDFEDLYEEWMARFEDGDPVAKIEFKLNSEDLDFLKKNGIKF